MEKDQLLAFRDHFVMGIKNESEITKRVLAAVPDTKREYRPDPKSKSGHELAWHLAAAEIWFLECIARGEFGGQEVPMLQPNMTGQQICAWYTEQLGNVLPRIEKMSAQDAARPVSFFGIATLPAVMFLSWAIGHSIHHRGQLSTYLRPMGGKVPSIYGGSADEPMKM